MPTSLSTAWRSLEVSVHQRWTIAGSGTIEVGAGYVQDRYQFTGDPAPDRDRARRQLQARADRRAGVAACSVASSRTSRTENRLVLSGGAMDRRYTLGTSVNGVHGALGAAVRVGRLEARLEGGLTLYSWTFRFDTSTTRPQADGGSDLVQNACSRSATRTDGPRGTNHAYGDLQLL